MKKDGAGGEKTYEKKASEIGIYAQKEKTESEKAEKSKQKIEKQKAENQHAESKNQEKKVQYSEKTDKRLRKNRCQTPKKQTPKQKKLLLHIKKRKNRQTNFPHKEKHKTNSTPKTEQTTHSTRNKFPKDTVHFSKNPGLIYQNRPSYSLTRPGWLHYLPGEVTLPPKAGNVATPGGSENTTIYLHKTLQPKTNYLLFLKI